MRRGLIYRGENMRNVERLKRRVGTVTRGGPVAAGGQAERLAVTGGRRGLGGSRAIFKLKDVRLVASQI